MIFVISKDFRGSKGHSCMYVVTASVHAPVLRSKGKACFFLYGKTVAISAKGEYFSWLAPFKYGNNSMSCNSLSVGNAHFIQTSTDICFGLNSIHLCFGDLMQVSSPSYNLFLQRQCFFLCCFQE